MKLEFNERFINKVKKQLVKENESEKRRRNFRKTRLRKSYFILMGFMVLLIGANVTRNLNKDIVDEKSAPVISKVEDNNIQIKEVKNNKNNIWEEFELPISKSKLLSYNFANGILNIQVEKNENILSMTEGIVENIYLDYSYGYTVVIRVNDGIVCKYSNLDSNIPVIIGESVQKGQIIGRTLDYALLESSYIYITVLNGAENINIVELFDNIK